MSRGSRDGVIQTRPPKSTLMSEQDPLVKECYAEINSALAPLQVNLPMPFDGPRAGEGAPDVFVRVCVAGKSIGFARIPAKRLTPADETMGPLQPPDEEKVPNGWNVQGWFQLQADALSNLNGPIAISRARQTSRTSLDSNDFTR